MTFYTSFSGFADVAEGETFSGEYKVIKRPLRGEIPDVTFTLLSVKPVYYQGTIPLRLEVRILTQGEERLIEINRPYESRGASFLVKKIDVAPLFILMDRRGNELDGAYVRLNVLKGDRDSFEMGDYRFRVSFFPDYKKGLNNLSGEKLPPILGGPLAERSWRSFEIKDPAFEFSVFKGSDLLNKETIKLGEAIRFDNHSLLFADLRYWVRFYVVGERGMNLIVIGSILIILALTVRFSFPRKEVSGFEEGQELYVSARSDFFRLKPPDF